MAVLFLMTVLLSQCSAQNLKIDISDTVRQHDLNKETAEFQAPVALQWGIADTSTNVGKIFKFAIPSDAFRGTIQSIKVSTINQVIVCVFCLCLYSDEHCILAGTTGLLAHIKKHWLHVGILPPPPSIKSLLERVPFTVFYESIMSLAITDRILRTISIKKNLYSCRRTYSVINSYFLKLSGSCKRLTLQEKKLTCHEEKP